MTYDADWMRDNRATLQAEDWQALDDFLACHAAQVRITEDDAADLARLAGHPDLIHRREHMTCAPHWTTTNAPSPAWMTRRSRRIAGRPPMTASAPSSGSSWSRCISSASASSAGRSARSSGNGSAGRRWRLLWYAPEIIAGVGLAWLAAVLLRAMGGDAP